MWSFGTLIGSQKWSDNYKSKTIVSNINKLSGYNKVDTVYSLRDYVKRNYTETGLKVKDIPYGVSILVDIDKVPIDYKDYNGKVVFDGSELKKLSYYSDCTIDVWTSINDKSYLDRFESGKHTVNSGKIELRDH